MRLFRALILPLITIVIIILLDSPLPTLPALGRLLDPLNGWAANAEAVSGEARLELDLSGISQPVAIFLEERQVPHLRAQSDEDLYFAQGYLHARYRLWQMEFQTHAAAGRISELVGPLWVKDPATGARFNGTLRFDRGQRRKGMVYAAENSLRAMEADQRTRTMLDAYTAGVNSYISSLNYRDLPLEYKLMGYEPEPWTNLKCALLLKYMADDLTGYTEDIPLSILRDKLPEETFTSLFPQRLQGSRPVIPEGTRFPVPSMEVPEAPGDTAWARLKEQTGMAAAALSEAPEEPGGIGSNNWVISGAFTSSGAPILCNDPHLGLNLPALWFEMQLQAPGLNVYGVSLPGAPGIIIGFNDSLSWGLTNNYRDVKDFYEIEAIDRDFYRFDGSPAAFTKRAETIRIKRQADFLDTVDYTIHGPVMYDSSYPDPAGTGSKLAMCWMAHRGTNELLSLYLLNRAKNYIEFVEALSHFECPAQNFVYADRAGNIALWGQGRFVNKWKDQGRYVMKGNTSATLWGEMIPAAENPHVLNPEQGYLASANQVTTDSSYPYWYNGYFYDFRAWRLNELLRTSRTSTVQDQMRIQNDVVSVLARNTWYPLNQMAGTTGSLRAWDFSLNPEDTTATRFQLLWGMFMNQMWKGQFSDRLLQPSPERTMQLVQDTSLGYATRVRQAARQAMADLDDSLERYRQTGLAWHQVKDTRLTHLAKLDAFSLGELAIGGWGNTLNAAKKSHGPSWRMVVELRQDSILAFGVYPGGQSGNPGSPHYGTFVTEWVRGNYYPIMFLPARQAPDRQRLPYEIILNPRNNQGS